MCYVYFVEWDFWFSCFVQILEYILLRFNSLVHFIHFFQCFYFQLWAFWPTIYRFYNTRLWWLHLYHLKIYNMHQWHLHMTYKTIIHTCHNKLFLLFWSVITALQVVQVIESSSLCSFHFSFFPCSLYFSNLSWIISCHFRKFFIWEKWWQFRFTEKWYFSNSQMRRQDGGGRSQTFGWVDGKGSERESVRSKTWSSVGRSRCKSQDLYNFVYWSLNWLFTGKIVLQLETQTLVDLSIQTAWRSFRNAAAHFLGPTQLEVQNKPI